MSSRALLLGSPEDIYGQKAPRKGGKVRTNVLFREQVAPAVINLAVKSIFPRKTVTRAKIRFFHPKKEAIYDFRIFYRSSLIHDHLW